MIEFIRGAWIAADHPDARGLQHCVEGGGEAGVPVVQDELDPSPYVFKVHEQVPGLLHDPGLDRVLRSVEDPDPAGAMLDHGQDIDLRAVEQVGGEEIQRQDPLRLRSQELRPAWAVPARPRVDPGPFEVAIFKLAGTINIAAACRSHARDATRVLAALGLSAP